MSLTVSWSSLRAHEECRQRVKLLRSGKKNPSANIRQYFHGTVVDLVMRNWLEDPVPGEMPSMVEESIEVSLSKALESGDGVVRWKHRQDRKEMTEWCQELVRRLEPILFELVIPFEYEPAKRFRVPIEIPYLDGSPTNIYLAGEIDLLVRDQTKTPSFQIWDLKGTNNNSYWRKTIAQTVFYDVAVGAMFGENTNQAGLIQPMCDQRVMPIQITDQDRATLMARIVKYAEYVWRHDWEPRRDTKFCNHCSVKHACPKFEPIQLGDHKRMSLTGMSRMAEVQGLQDLVAEDEAK